MNKAALIFSIALLGSFFIFPAQAGLPPSVEKDRLFLELSNTIKSKSYSRSVDLINRIERLNGVRIPNGFWYYKGEALYNTDDFDGAKAALTTYFNQTGTSGKFYKRALGLYNKTETGNQVLGPKLAKKIVEKLTFHKSYEFCERCVSIDGGKWYDEPKEITVNQKAHIAEDFCNIEVKTKISSDEEYDSTFTKKSMLKLPIVNAYDIKQAPIISLKNKASGYYSLKTLKFRCKSISDSCSLNEEDDRYCDAIDVNSNYCHYMYKNKRERDSFVNDMQKLSLACLDVKGDYTLNKKSLKTPVRYENYTRNH